MKLTTQVKDSHQLGQIISQTRMYRNISQRNLASILGVSQKWIWEMEQGKPGILMKRLFEILERLGITLTAEFEASDASGKPAGTGKGLHPEGAGTFEDYKLSARMVADALTRFGRQEDVENFASSLIFGIMAGTLETHTKIIGILRFPDESFSITSVYDLAPISHGELTLNDIVRELTSWHCASFPGEQAALDFTLEFLEKCSVAVNSANPSGEAEQELINKLSGSITNLLLGMSVQGATNVND